MNATQVEPTAALAELKEKKPDSVTIVCLSGDMDKAMAAFIIATGAAAMGMKVTMFFTFLGPQYHHENRDQPVLLKTGCARLLGGLTKVALKTSHSPAFTSVASAPT